MNTIETLNIKYGDQAVEFILDSGVVVELSAVEISKLTFAANSLGSGSPLSRGSGQQPNNSLFTPAIKAAIDGKIINFTEGLMVLDWTNKGFANVLITGDNPLKDKFPGYWSFLESYRTAIGDPNAI